MRHTGVGGAAGSPPTPNTDSNADSKADPSASPDASPSPAASATTATPIRVARGDGVLTVPLVAAVKRWQGHTGLAVTGVLGPGDVAVLSGAVRIDSVQAQPGDLVAGPLLSVTHTGKWVTVRFDPTDVGSVRAGDPVTVTLPDQSTVRGAVAGVGAVVQGGSGEGGDGGEGARLTVTVSVSDTPALQRLDAAPVEVAFTARTRKGVLAVPVEALLALSGGGYAVQLPGGRLIAVETGLFARGMVEISGAGLRPGLSVVTAS
ncbi:peptidoglycan-binding protein [Streptomyces mirabilis]|uniref:peptidoglycan-binding domain-containing protein n=1 Tax=Streptomyces mirabilis TaxID=68239 RepID=UPI0021BF0232|nr:peptidoglycan-binding domain-containing protein [Streptomyces mirabilis]MCT9112514.1 peptidoglycan-binding protein [Streptomyces mirabilis]